MPLQLAAHNPGCEGFGGCGSLLALFWFRAFGVSGYDWLARNVPQRSSVMSEVNLSTDETRVSYGIGRQLGDQLRDNPPPGVSLDAILAGLTDAFAGKESRVGQEEMSASFKVIREIMQAGNGCQGRSGCWRRQGFPG